MKRLPIYLILAAAFLTLTAEDCLLEEKMVEVPVRDSEDMLFHTQGTEQNTDTEDVDFQQALLDLEADNEFDQLLSAQLENAWWRVDMNNGDGGLGVQGKVTVEQLPAAPGLPHNAVAVDILSYQSQSIDAALGAFQPVTLAEEGVTLMNQAFEDWLVARADGTPENQLPSVNFRFVWTANITGGGSEPNVDFTWEGKIKFTLTGLVTVDVPEF